MGIFPYILSGTKKFLPTMKRYLLAKIKIKCNRESILRHLDVYAYRKDSLL
jgi:hypothetical protein